MSSSILVAMSGGVDSSVTAGIFQKKGKTVHGVTLILCDSDPSDCACACESRPVHDARSVAAHLGLQHTAYDRSELFKTVVIDRFSSDYAQGKTPNPCIVCNRHVKFDQLMRIANEKGIEKVATGHYVEKRVGDDGTAELHQGADPRRDQSYFLFAITQEQLDRTEFPLGTMSKDATRALAREWGIPVANKPDSQDICFVSRGSYVEAITAACPPGEIVHIDGRVLGTHQGVNRFTVGQRRGIGISDPAGPLFVVRITPPNVVVGPYEALGCTRLFLEDTNWFAAPNPQRKYLIKARSAQTPVSATVASDHVILDAPLHGVAPGQACVVYDGTRVVGGGWICGTGS